LDLVLWPLKLVFIALPRTRVPEDGPQIRPPHGAIFASTFRFCRRRCANVVAFPGDACGAVASAAEAAQKQPVRFRLTTGLDALQRPCPVDATAGHALAKRVAGATALSTAESGQPLLTAATTARGGGRSRSARKRQTDLRQDAIEDLRGQREQLRTAARKTLRRVRNAEKRPNRVLTRLWNLYATSVLAVLMDRDSGPSAAPASAARGRCSCSRT
jgi:hypothetical protein